VRRGPGGEERRKDPRNERGGTGGNRHARRPAALPASLPPQQRPDHGDDAACMFVFFFFCFLSFFLFFFFFSFFFFFLFCFCFFFFFSTNPTGAPMVHAHFGDREPLREQAVSLQRTSPPRRAHAAADDHGASIQAVVRCEERFAMVRAPPISSIRRCTDAAIARWRVVGCVNLRPTERRDLLAWSPGGRRRGRCVRSGARVDSRSRLSGAQRPTRCGSGRGISPARTRAPWAIGRDVHRSEVRAIVAAQWRYGRGRLNAAVRSRHRTRTRQDLRRIKATSRSCSRQRVQRAEPVSSFTAPMVTGMDANREGARAMLGCSKADHAVELPPAQSPAGHGEGIIVGG